MLALLLAIAVPLASNPDFNKQCYLEASGFSVNCIDGSWGPRSRRAMELFKKSGGKIPQTPYPLVEVEVTALDLNEIVAIPKDPAEKAELEYLGYESIKEMFAERGHVSRRCLEKLNPEITDWSDIRAGTKIRIPDFPPLFEPRNPRGRAASVQISLSRCEMTAHDADGRIIAFFPCSIAADKAKLPPHGELAIVSRVENPNYTFTPDEPPPEGEKPKRHIFEPGPNNPVGLAWMGLDLPGYGIHGTPLPERVGNAESHGCFRLSNWNALRLYRMTDSDTKVIIVP